jgi:hypothetical protein
MTADSTFGEFWSLNAVYSCFLTRTFLYTLWNGIELIELIKDIWLDGVGRCLWSQLGACPLKVIYSGPLKWYSRRIFPFGINFHILFFGCNVHQNQLTPWSLARLGELPVTQPLKSFQSFYGTWRFITMFKRALCQSVSWARSVQSIPPYLISLRFIWISSSHLHLSLPSGFFPSGFHPKILHSFLFSPMLATSHPISSPLTSSFYLYLAKSASYEAPHCAVFSNLCHFISSLFGSNILLSILFSKHP